MLSKANEFTLQISECAEFKAHCLDLQELQLQIDQFWKGEMNLADAKTLLHNKK